MFLPATTSNKQTQNINKEKKNQQKHMTGLCKTEKLYLIIANNTLSFSKNIKKKKQQNIQVIVFNGKQYLGAITMCWCCNYSLLAKHLQLILHTH